MTTTEIRFESELGGLGTYWACEVAHDGLPLLGGRQAVFAASSTDEAARRARGMFRGDFILCRDGRCVYRSRGAIRAS